MMHGEETRAVKRRIRSKVTLTPPPPSLSLLHLPSHLVEDILFRVPVKSLLQLRCICKRLNSLICDPKFPQKHLRFSKNSFQLNTTSQRFKRITSYPIHSIFSSYDLGTSTHFKCPPSKKGEKLSPKLSPNIVGSCDGILCIAIRLFLTPTSSDVIVMCNPSIRKFNHLPLLLEEENPEVFGNQAYGFGHDHLSHNYKVVVVKEKTSVKIHTLGTHSWRSIGDFPFGFPAHKVGVSLSGTVNWLASKDSNDNHGTIPDSPCIIVSLNLGNECYQQFPLPNYGRTIPLRHLSLTVQRDCLCLFADHDVWMMKEFGNQNSWTKLITIPYLKHPTTSYGFRKLLYISEDDKFVLDAYGLQGNLIVYDSRNGIVKYLTMWNPPHLSIESLISP